MEKYKKLMFFGGFTLCLACTSGNSESIIPSVC